MSQYFDALERQLVALSSETPRMTPQARAKRRLAIGTVTALSLLVLVVGSSMLPHLVSKPEHRNDALLATLRLKHSPHLSDQTLTGWPGVGHTLEAVYESGSLLAVAWQSQSAGRSR